MAWSQKYSIGQLVAAGFVFLALVAIAIPSNLKSRRKDNHRSIIRYIQAFQNAACKRQNNTPSLRFFENAEDITEEEFALEPTKFGYIFSYIPDKSQLRFVFLAIPTKESSENWGFYGDETGTIYTIELNEAALQQYRSDDLEEMVDFSADLDERLPHSWIPN